MKRFSIHFTSIIKSKNNNIYCWQDIIYIRVVHQIWTSFFFTAGQIYFYYFAVGQVWIRLTLFVLVFTLAGQVQVDPIFPKSLEYFFR